VSSAPAVLFVDDDEVLLNSMRRVLRKQPYRVLIASSGERALEILQDSVIDVIVSDERMPQMQGSELLAKVADKYPGVVRILLTGEASVEAAQRSINEGRVFRLLTKPIETSQMVDTLERAVHHGKRLGAGESWDAVTDMPMEKALHAHIERIQARGCVGVPSLLLLFWVDGLDFLRVLPHSDIQKSLTQQISKRLKSAVENTIDLQVGATMDLGEAGDQVRAAEDGAFVARMSTGEFAVVFQPTEHCDALDLAKAFCRRLAGGFNVYGRTYYIDAYCGVVTDVAAQQNAAESLAAARIALSRAKSKSTPDRLAFFDETLTAQMKRQVDIESDFQYALQTRALQVYYQPIVDAVDQHIVAAEALLRWRHDEHGWVNPERMVAIAEARGIMHRLTMHVLGVACRQHAQWKAEGLIVSMSVNVSASEFEHPRFVEYVLDAVDTYQMDANHLQLEITERVVMEEPERALAIIDRLRQRDIRVALDDFGVGYSSLSYLMKLRPDTLKIDRSFVMSAMSDKVAATVLESIVAMALRLGVPLVAEGIETEQHREYLACLGAHSLQGYLYGPAVDAASFGRDLAADYEARKQKKR